MNTRNGGKGHPASKYQTLTLQIHALPCRRRFDAPAHSVFERRDPRGYSLLLLLQFILFATPFSLPYRTLCAREDMSIGTQPGLIPILAMKTAAASFGARSSLTAHRAPGTILFIRREVLYVVAAQRALRSLRLGVGARVFKWQGLLVITPKQDGPRLDATARPEMIERHLPARFMAGLNPMVASSALSRVRRLLS